MIGAELAEYGICHELTPLPHRGLPASPLPFPLTPSYAPSWSRTQAAMATLGALAERTMARHPGGSQAMSMLSSMMWMAQTPAGRNLWDRRSAILLILFIVIHFIGVFLFVWYKY